jgi:hypothetical protein
LSIGILCIGTGEAQSERNPQRAPQTTGANPGNTKSMDEQAGGNNQAVERKIAPCTATKKGRLRELREDNSSKNYWRVASLM